MERTSSPAISWAALLLPPHVVTQSCACAERGKMQIFQLSALLPCCCSLDTSVGSGSLCCMWVTFARDKTSPNYTSFACRAQQAMATAHRRLSAPKGARQARLPLQGLRSLPSWMSCGSNSTGSWCAQPSQNSGTACWAAQVTPLVMPSWISLYFLLYFLLHSLP